MTDFVSGNYNRDLYVYHRGSLFVKTMCKIRILSDKLQTC